MRYYRVMLGKGSQFAAECFQGSFIGADFIPDQDLTEHLPDEWRDFNREYIPIYLADHPSKTRVAAGLACGVLWTIARGLDQGDMVLCPDGQGHYYVGTIDGGYSFHKGEILPHRRPVRWMNQTIDRQAMSKELQGSTGFTGTVSTLDTYADEINRLLGSSAKPPIISTDETIQDPYAFAMEQHLEEFLVKNWEHTALGKNFSIYRDGEQVVGEQYQTDTGLIDILAVSKDKKTVLVVELKRGRASDAVVGQTLRYMGYVKEVLAEANQQVRGVIIALEDDQRIRRALSVSPNIEFYRYEVSFQLRKAEKA